MKTYKEFHVYYSNGNVRRFDAENIIALRWYLYNENRDLEYIETIAWEASGPRDETILWEEDWVTCRRRHSVNASASKWTDWE